MKIGKVMANKCFTESTLDLTCSYNLGGDTLYSVKWYKGRHEFYRYMPTENPIIKTFPVKNMKINVSTFELNQMFVFFVPFLLTMRIIDKAIYFGVEFCIKQHI